MRLIDAEAKALNPETINEIDFDTAIKEVEAFLNSDECKYPLHIYLCAVRDFAEWYRDELKEAPTISAVPVVRGEWVEAKSGVMSVWPEGQVMCSACGQRMPLAWKKMPPYCYGCGAKMEDKPCG